MKPKMKKFLLILVVVIACVFYIYFVLFGFQKTKTDLLSQKASLIQENKLLEQAISDLKSSENQLGLLREEVAHIQEKLNHDLSDGAFLVNLTEKVKKEGLIMASYTTDPIEDLGSFYALPGKVTLVGNYRGVMNTLNYMEFQPNMTQIQDLTIRKLEEEGELAQYFGSAEELGLLTERILAERDPATVLPGESPYEEIEITRVLDINLTELFDGRVMAECVYILYTVPTPEAKIQLQNIQNWQTGNSNPFEN